MGLAEMRSCKTCEDLILKSNHPLAVVSAIFFRLSRLAKPYFWLIRDTRAERVRVVREKVRLCAQR